MNLIVYGINVSYKVFMQCQAQLSAKKIIIDW